MNREKVRELFPIGSRVLVSSARSMAYGNEGVVVCYSGATVGVDFGGTLPFPGHDLDGAIKTNTGWYCTAESLSLVDQPLEIEPEIEWNMVFE